MTIKERPPYPDLGCELTDFDGKNCEDPCSGWDGYSNRCECGNRRVSWQWCAILEQWIAEAH